MRFFLFLVLVFFFSGCFEPSPSPSEGVLKQDHKQISFLAQEYQDSKENAKKYSKWYDREEKLPLTIIATAYIDPNVKKTKEYFIYKKLCAYIAKHPDVLGEDLKKKYASIQFIDFSKNTLAQKKFQLAYELQKSEKEKLLDVLRPTNEHSSQELLIALDYKDLQKGNLTIRGYKTVKESDKKRDAFFFTLTKKSYGSLSKKEKKKAILNSIQAALKLSIPSYVSIDRKVLPKDKTLRFIVPESNNTYKGEVWKYIFNDELESVTRQIKELYEKSIDDIASFPLQSTVTDMVIDPTNDRYALMGLVNGNILYYDLLKRNVVKTFKGHKDTVKSVALSSNGRYALSGGRDQQGIIWDMRTAKIIKKFQFPDMIASVAISADNRYGVFGCFDGKIYVIDMKKKQKLYDMQLDKVAVLKVAFHPKKPYLLASSLEKWKLYYVDIPNKKLKTTFVNNQHYAFIRYISFLGDNKIIVSTENDYYTDSKIAFYDLHQQKPLDVIQTNISMKAQVISKDKRYLIAISKLGYIQWYDLATKKLFLEKKLSNSLNTAGLALNKTTLFVAGDSLTGIKIDFNRKTKQKLSLLYKTRKDIEKKKKYRAYLTKQLLFTSAFPKNDIDTLYEYGYINSKNSTLKTIQEIADSLEYSYFDPYISFLYTPYNEKNNFSIQKDDTIMIVKSKEQYDLDQLYFSSLYDLSQNGFKKVYKTSLESLKNYLISYEIEHTNTINDVAITPNGNYIFSVSHDETMKMWSVKKPPESIYTFNFDTDEFSQSVLSVIANNNIVIAGGDYSIKIFDIKTKKLLKVFSLNDDVSEFALYKNYLLAGLYNGEIILYDLKKYRKLFSYKVKEKINSVAFSLDGKHFIVVESKPYELDKKHKEHIYLFDTQRKKLLKKLDTNVKKALYVPNAIVVVDNMYLKFYDQNLKKELYRLSQDGSSSIEDLHLSYDKRFLIIAHSSFLSNSIWDLKNKKCILNEGLGDFAPISNNNFIVNLYNNDSALRVWNLKYYLLKAKY